MKETKGYDVIGVNVFHFTLMRSHFTKEVNSFLSYYFDCQPNSLSKKFLFGVSCFVGAIQHLTQRLLITLDTELVLTTFAEVYKKLRLLYFAICVLLFFFIATLLKTNNCKNFSTVEPRNNELLYDKVLHITNDILCPSYS